MDNKKLLSALKEYADALAPFHTKILQNENVFKNIGKEDQTGVKNLTPFLLNAIWNKHADAMDNFPTPTFLPTSPQNEQSAKMLGRVVPVLLEHMNFAQVYSDMWWYKLKQGVACMGAFYSAQTGQIVLKNVDMLRLYFHPKVANIQDSPYVFCLSLADKEPLEKSLGKPLKDTTAINDYFGDYTQNQREGKVCITDCYYKKDGVVHLKKLCGEEVLFDSEKTPSMRQKGLYAHGCYPFVLDNLIPLQGTALGLGLIDIGAPAQRYIDQLDNLILQNAQVSGKQRFLVREGSGVDMAALTDLSQNFVSCDLSVSDDAVRPLQANSLPGFIMAHRTGKIGELKDVVGNKDFTTGGVMGGITAYSAIVALQEAGNKLSRDVIDSGYRAFKELVCQLIWLLNQFTVSPKTVYVDGEFVAVHGRDITPDLDVKIIPQKKNPFSVAEHNQLVMDLYKLGAFDPERSQQTKAALSAMYLDGKEEILNNLNTLEQPQQQQAL